MLKPLTAPARAPQPPEAIRAKHKSLTAAARKHMEFGILSATDRKGLIKRTAQLCGVSVEQVREVCGG